MDANTSTAMDSLPQPSPQTSQPSQTTQQSPTAQLVIGQQMSQMDVQQPNSGNDSSVSSGVTVSMSANLMSTNVSEAQNSSSVSSSVPSASVAPSLVSQGSTQSQLIVSSSQPQLSQLVPTSQTANGMIGQPLASVMTSMANVMTSMANQSVQMTAQAGQPSQMQPLLQTSVQPTGANQMSVTMSPLSQVQVIQQPIGATTGYQFQSVYPVNQGMILPGNLTIQNMPFGAPNQGLSLQIPFSGTGGVSTGTMPITSIAAKPPIMSKGVAISPLNQQQHMISPLKPNMAPHGTQILKQVLPTQQFVPHSAANQTVVISQILPQPNQHSVQQSILPANANKLLEAPKGKPFGMGSVRSAFGNKMLSHSGAIQPKSPILPATSMASPLLANSQFKSPFAPNQNTTQLIATQTPSNLITNPQILGSFQTIGPGLTWTTSPHSTQLVAPNGSPIFIRGPTQSGEHMFISTSNMSNLSNPQIQAVSMPTPISVQSSTATPMQVSAVTSQQNQIQQMTMNTPPQTYAVNTSVQSTTTTAVTSQMTAITPTSVPSNTNKSKRQSSSVSTQTIGQSTAQKVESTTNLKPIAPAKPKPNAQQTAANKQAHKDSGTTTMSPRSTSVDTTQTVQTTPIPSNTAKPQTNPAKSDASNQTNKISISTETPKVNSQVSSSRVNDHNKSIAKNSANASTETKEHKIHSSGESTKLPLKKVSVEKKDASTEQDSELSTNFFAQTNHKSVQNSIHVSNTTNTLGHINGQQIPVLSDLNRQDISKPLQKAIVKPQKSQILTHVIDGYIIQESANPFPVNGIGYSSDSRSDGIDGIEALKTKNKNENSNLSASSSSKIRTNSERHICMNCGGKRKPNSKTNRTLKKFCSESCSKKYTLNKNNPGSRLVLHNLVTGHLDTHDIQRTSDLPMDSINELEKQSFDEKKKLKTLKRIHENSIDITNSTKNEKTSNESSGQKSGATTSDGHLPLVNCVLPSTNSTDDSNNYIPPGGRNPLQWTVNDVYEFVRNTQGCTEYAEEFRSQEIDGQALMLIKEDHLMSSQGMSMKLGPALKICSKINALREEAQRQN